LAVSGQLEGLSFSLQQSRAQTDNEEAAGQIEITPATQSSKQLKYFLGTQLILQKMKCSFYSINPLRVSRLSGAHLGQ